MMKSLHLLLLSLVALMNNASSQDNATVEVTPDLCFAKFVGLSFTFNDYDRYPVFFRNESIFINPYAGRYQGPENIKEYARFLGYNTTFVENVSGINTPGFNGISDEGICEFLLMTHSWYDFNQENARGIGYNLTLMSKVFFDPIEEYIETFVIYLPPIWMEDLFGVALGTSRTREFICDDVMYQACPDIWELNLATLEEHSLSVPLDTSNAVAQGRIRDDVDDNTAVLLAACMDMLAKLPITTDGDHYIDGNSYSCRALHSAFALDNEHHCPHISFVPQEDEDGKIKCQESEKVESSMYFTEADFAKFEEFQAAHSDVVDLPDGFKVLYLEELPDEGNMESEVYSDGDGADGDDAGSESSSAAIGLRSTRVATLSCVAATIVSMLA